VPLLPDCRVECERRGRCFDSSPRPSHIGLPLLGPPGIPTERLEILRQSYQHLMDDADYRAEADRRACRSAVR